MAEATELLRGFLTGLLCFLGAGILACLVRAIRGPRYTDRVVALNLICTLVILMIAVLSYLLEESYLMDVAILYGLLNLLAVAHSQPSGHQPPPAAEGGGAMTLRIGLAIVLMSLGAAVILISVVGLFRLKDVLERLHAGALTDTLGVLLIVAGLAVLCGFTVHTVKLVLLVVILWVTNPVSSHLIARMELITGRDREPDRLTGEGEEEL